MSARTHGTISCYKAGCHCIRCQRAAAMARRRFRARRDDGTGQFPCGLCGRGLKSKAAHVLHERACRRDREVLAA